MGHLSHHKAYRDLQQHIDRLPASLPDTPRTLAILEMLFTPEEAALVARLPLKPRSAHYIAQRLGMQEPALRRQLDELADRGLILDLHNAEKQRTYYCVAPPVVGFVEFSMMRVRTDLDQGRLARLYEEFFEKDQVFGQSLFAGETQIGRTLVHESALAPDDVAELLTHERASQIVEHAEVLSVSLCYCRHKAEHLGKACSRPRENCLSLNRGAEYIIRHGLGRAIERSAALEVLHQAREEAMVHIADNVQNNVTYICNCCGCCCGQLQAINRYGFEGAVKTSAFIAEIEPDKCTGCGRCARRCPVQAIELRALPPHVQRKTRMFSVVSEAICLGCGICQPACRKGALTLRPRPERVITPEATLERLLAMALERDRLQHLLFEEIDGFHMIFMNKLVGAILKLPPVKQALLSKQLKSRFIAYLARGYRGASTAAKTV